MPDPVLPIFGFVMSVIGWYGMLRTGVQFVHDDLQAASTHKRDVKAILDDLDRQQRALEAWRSDWLIFEGTSQSFFVALWGKDELETIDLKVANMKDNHEVGQKKLSAYVKLKHEEDWQKMSKLKRSWLSLSFIWTKKNYVQKLTERMATDMQSINTAANTGWMRKRTYPHNVVDFREVYHTAIGHLLLPIAMSARDDASALHHGCRAAQGSIIIRLDLDVFDHSGDVSQRPESEGDHRLRIANAAKNGHLTWMLVVADPTRGEGFTSRMAVERSETPPNSSLSPPIAFTQVMQNLSSKSYFHSFQIPFSVGRAKKPYEWTNEPTRTLEESLRHTPNNPGIFRSSQLAALSKHRIAFELAQACLLFLTTPWFPGICSCSIFCKALPPTCSPFKHEFALNIENRDENVQGERPLHRGNRWCNVGHNWNFLTNPVRRLGLLLVEVFLGAPVQRITTTAGGIIDTVQMSSPDREEPPAALHPEKIDVLLGRVDAGLREEDRVRHAVEYCLTEVLPNDAPSDANMKDILARFYFYVVAPLKDHYDAHLERVRSTTDRIHMAQIQ